MKRIVYLLLFSLFIISCDFSGKEVTFNEVNINGQYKLSVPDFMKSTTELNDDASLQYMNMYKETYMIVIDEPKDSFVEIYKENEKYDDSISIIENYKKTQLESIASFVEGYKAYDEKVKPYRGNPSMLTKVDGVVDNFDVTYFFRFVEGNEHLYMLMGWTEQKRNTKYEPTFTRILNSFSETN